MTLCNPLMKVYEGISCVNVEGYNYILTLEIDPICQDTFKIFENYRNWSFNFEIFIIPLKSWTLLSQHSIAIKLL